jgi:hypothetical protein
VHLPWECGIFQHFINWGVELAYWKDSLKSQTWTETLQFCRYQLLSQNTFSRRFQTPSKLIASVYKICFLPSTTCSNRVQSLIPSCGKGTSDLKINTTALAWECCGTWIAHELSMWQEILTHHHC